MGKGETEENVLALIKIWGKEEKGLKCKGVEKEKEEMGRKIRFQVSMVKCTTAINTLRTIREVGRTVCDLVFRSQSWIKGKLITPEKQILYSKHRIIIDSHICH